MKRLILVFLLCGCGKVGGPHAAADRVDVANGKAETAVDGLKVEFRKVWLGKFKTENPFGGPAEDFKRPTLNIDLALSTDDGSKRFEHEHWSEQTVGRIVVTDDLGNKYEPLNFLFLKRAGVERGSGPVQKGRSFADFIAIDPPVENAKHINVDLTTADRVFRFRVPRSSWR